MSPAPPTNPRRLRRFIENQAFAKDARFWTGKVKTAERVGDVLIGVNRQATRQLTRKGRNARPAGSHDVERWKRRNRPTHMVYVVKFVQVGGGEPFLKIGLTGNDILKRFELDFGRYEVELIQSIPHLRRKDALLFEQALHELFRPRKYRPPLPLLSGGNSECYKFTTDLETAMTDLIRRWTAALAQR